MIGSEDSFYTYEYAEHFKILPSIYNWGSSEERIKNGKQVPEGFNYSSDNNSDWMSVVQLREWIASNRHKIGSL
jgi:hypothetical protein